MIYECITHRQQNGLTVQYQFLNRANVYFRPTGYYIKNPHRADGKAACQQMKRKKKKTTQPFKSQLNCWKQLKIKTTPLCTCILDGPRAPVNNSPTRPMTPAHLCSHTEEYTSCPQFK